MKKNERYRTMLNPMFFAGIAHRGLHDDKLTENGLKAFKAAIDNHMAFELDIHLTKDGELIVCHDSDLIRTTGKSGIIEDLTAKEIRENYRLLDGETIPLFQEVLDLNHERSLIVVELKCWKKNYKTLALAARKILEPIRDKKKIMIISFYPQALSKFGKQGFLRSLLVCKDKFYAWKFHFLFESVDVEKCLLQSDAVIKYRRKGGIVNVWTIENLEELEKANPYTDGITFQGISAKNVRQELQRHE